MKGFLIRLAVLILVLAVLGYLLYPVFSDQYAQSQLIPQMERYQAQVKTLSAQGKAGILAEWTAINKKVAAGDADAAAQPQTVNGLMGILEIPSIGVRLPIYPAGMENALQNGVTPIPGWALPTGQKGVRAGLTGANGRLGEGELGYMNLLAAQLLHRLGQVKTGDMIYLYLPAGDQVYQTVATGAIGQTALPEGEENEAWLTITNGEGGNAEVLGRLVTLPEGKDILARSDQPRVPADWVNVLCIGSPVLLVGLILMALVELFRRRHYRLPADSKISKNIEG